MSSPRTTLPWAENNPNGTRTAGPRVPGPTESRRPTGGQDWRHRAACRDEDPELFQPIGSSGPALLQIEDAKRVCGRCPVILECGDWALTAPVEFGVLGGMSEDDRRALKRRAARQRSRMGSTRVAE